MRSITTLGMSGLLLLVFSGVASAQAQQGRFEQTLYFYDPCNDELVMADVIFHIVETPDGVTRNNVKGVAVGLSTGNVYQWVGTARVQGEDIVDGNTVTSLLTGTSSLRLISQGASPNLVLTTYIELGLVITFDPDTGLPIDFQTFDNTVEVIDCRGSQP